MKTSSYDGSLQISLLSSCNQIRIRTTYLGQCSEKIQELWIKGVVANSWNADDAKLTDGSWRVQLRLPHFILIPVDVIRTESLLLAVRPVDVIVVRIVHIGINLSILNRFPFQVNYAHILSGFLLVWRLSWSMAKTSLLEVIKMVSSDTCTHKVSHTITMNTALWWG